MFASLPSWGWRRVEVVRLLDFHVTSLCTLPVLPLQWFLSLTVRTFVPVLALPYELWGRQQLLGIITVLADKYSCLGFVISQMYSDMLWSVVGGAAFAADPDKEESRLRPGRPNAPAAQGRQQAEPGRPRSPLGSPAERRPRSAGRPSVALEGSSSLKSPSRKKHERPASGALREGAQTSGDSARETKRPSDVVAREIEEPQTAAHGADNVGSSLLTKDEGSEPQADLDGLVAQGTIEKPDLEGDLADRYRGDVIEGDGGRREVVEEDADGREGFVLRSGESEDISSAKVPGLGDGTGGERGLVPAVDVVEEGSPKKEKKRKHKKDKKQKKEHKKKSRREQEGRSLVPYSVDMELYAAC